MAPRTPRGLPGEPPQEVVDALAEACGRATGIADWTFEQWFEAITRMRLLSEKHGLKLHKPDPNIFVTPSGAVGQVGRATITILEPSVGQVLPFVIYPGNPEPRILDGVIVPRAALPAMLVDLSGSDEHIRSEVEKALRNRKVNKAIPRTTGPYSISGYMRSPYTTERWRCKCIVQLVEMLAWTAAGGHNYTKIQLGCWIDPGRLNTEKRFDSAVAVARQAIAALPAILVEVKPS